MEIGPVENGLREGAVDLWKRAHKVLQAHKNLNQISCFEGFEPGININHLHVNFCENGIILGPCAASQPQCFATVSFFLC